MTATRNDPQRKRLEDHTEPIIGISAPDHGNHPFYHSLDSKLVDKATHWNQTRAAGQSFLRKPRLRSDSPDAPPTHLFFLHTSQVPCFSGRFRLFHDQKSTRFRGVRTGRSSDYPSVFSLLARSRYLAFIFSQKPPLQSITMQTSQSSGSPSKTAATIF